MPQDNDWRLTGQERYLKGKTLLKRKYRCPRPDWDHDHCEFCWAKFMEKAGADVLQDGYVTEDNQHWICAQCFADFRNLFQWTVNDD
jgi:hypothetical protein